MTLILSIPVEVICNNNFTCGDADWPCRPLQPQPCLKIDCSSDDYWQMINQCELPKLLALRRLNRCWFLISSTMSMRN